jgi:hypothetical protein
VTKGSRSREEKILQQRIPKGGEKKKKNSQSNRNGKFAISEIRNGIGACRQTRALLAAFGRVISTAIIGSRQVRNLILILAVRISRIPSTISDNWCNSRDKTPTQWRRRTVAAFVAGMHFSGFRAYTSSRETGENEECVDTQTNPMDALPDSPQR